MPDDTPLIPASRADLVDALMYALRFDERGKPHRLAVDSTAQLAAQTLVRCLEQAGFVVMRRAPAKAPTTPRSA